MRCFASATVQRAACCMPHLQILPRQDGHDDNHHVIRCTLSSGPTHSTTPNNLNGGRHFERSVILQWFALVPLLIPPHTSEQRPLGNSLRQQRLSVTKPSLGHCLFPAGVSFRSGTCQPVSNAKFLASVCSIIVRQRSRLHFSGEHLDRTF